MSEIHFIVEETPEGGYVARAVSVDILTEADDLPNRGRSGQTALGIWIQHHTRDRQSMRLTNKT